MGRSPNCPTRLFLASTDKAPPEKL